MPDHIRKLIRGACKAQLEAALPAVSVFNSRRYSVNSSELPVIDMWFGNENSERQTMRGGPLFRVGSLYLRYRTAAVGEQIDDLLDDAATTIEVAMATDGLLDGLAKTHMLVQTNYAGGSDGGNVTTEDIILRYDISYQTEINNPATAR